MDALIHLVPDAPRSALLDIAGKPLLLRQIQWLRAAGFERVVVELPPGDLEAAVTALLDAEPLGPSVSSMPASGLAPRLLATAPGVGLSSRVLLLPANVLGDGDLVRVLLKASSDNIEVVFRPPGKRLDRLGGANAFLLGPNSTAPRRVSGPGWGALIEDEDSAFALSLAILDGAVTCNRSSAWPVQVHATRVSSGIWVARGAEVHDTAHLVRPVFIGAGAVVSRGAVIGPGVLVGNDAVVGSGSRLQAASVEPGAQVPAEARLAETRVVPVLPGRRRPVPLWLGLAAAMLLLAGLALHRAPAPGATLSSAVPASLGAP